MGADDLSLGIFCARRFEQGCENCSPSQDDPGTVTAKSASPRPHKVWSDSCCCRECSLVSALLAECPGANGSWRDWWQKASEGQGQRQRETETKATVETARQRLQRLPVPQLRKDGSHLVTVLEQAPQRQKQQLKQQDKDNSDCQCHNCRKMGHISSQCWSKPRKGKGKGKDKTVSAVQESTSARSASDVAVLELAVPRDQ